MSQLLNNIRNRRVGWLAVTRVGAMGLAALLWLAPPVAFSQTAAGDERYQPERSREDYEQPADTGQEFDYAAQTLRVAVWLDREEEEIYSRGDEQRVGFQTNEDAYAVVYRIDTDGRVAVLWPRDRMDDGFVFGGHEYRLPGREASALRIDEPEGEGFVQAIVSRYPFDLRALELDFLQDDGDKRYDFRVAGDPFLAMNEVNYAVTGLKDSGDQVITNHVRYYVHRIVDHPRYLCSQCHTEDSMQYDPYKGNCTLSIEYDYGWSNRWYSTYGYYPAYWNPVYAYVDPWTWQPWVNFWYDPWYVCAPYYGWYGSYWGCYTWNDSPYYGGGCGSNWDDGTRRYQPLNRHGDSVVVSKTREYDTVTRAVSRTAVRPAEREAMLARRTAAGVTREARGTDLSAAGAAPLSVAHGDKPMVRSSERYPVATATRQGAGLRIRPGGGRAVADASVGKRPEGPTRRHTAAGADAGARLAPVRPSDRKVDAGTRSPAEAGRVRSGDGGAARDGGRETIRALNPRQRGSRVWNSTTGRGNQQAERGERPDRPARVRPDGSGAAGRDDPEATAPTGRPRRDGGQQQVSPPSGGREGTAPRGGAVTPRAGQQAPQSGREGRETAPAPARQGPPRRTESPKSRSSDDGEADKSTGGAARRAPTQSKK